MSEQIWVCGEVLADLFSNLEDGERTFVLGGGPANTAKALARLGYDVEFIDGISTDNYGVAARAELERDGVGLHHVVVSDKPTSQAIISLDSTGSASYEFCVEGTATFGFSHSWLPIDKPAVLHIGSLATVIEPGASVLLEWALKISTTSPVIFDPNVRPAVLPDIERYRMMVEKWIDISSVVKVSEEDMAWLYPQMIDEDVARRWIAQGVTLVVITRGADGLVAISQSDRFSVPGVSVPVVDTVGAGDTVGAIIVEGIVKFGLDDLVGENLKNVLHRAAKAASITVSRQGAQPPYAHEIGTF